MKHGIKAVSLALAGLAFGHSSVTLAGDAPTFAQAIRGGVVSAQVRLRDERVTQSGLQDAEALTVRTRLAFTTLAYAHLRFSAELENIIALDGDAYDQAGLNPGGKGKAVVSDPEITELNQLWGEWSQSGRTLKVGRQRLALDNGRFIGDAGWRQNQQTFDAAVLQDRSWAGTTLTYGYIDAVNRVVGRHHPQGRYDSQSHVLQADRAFRTGSVAAYAYLLDFDPSPSNSCATYGVNGRREFELPEGARLTLRGAWATQQDDGRSPLEYRAEYSDFEVGVKRGQWALAAEREQLGSGNRVGFKTPLASLHAFNGWADLFTTTPTAGVRDFSVKASTDLPAKAAFTLWWHDYEAVAESREYGTEWDALISRPFGRRVQGVVKFADFHSRTTTFPDVRKVWVQVDLTL